VILINKFFDYFNDKHYYEFPDNFTIWILDKNNETLKIGLQQLSRGLMTIKRSDEAAEDVTSNKGIKVDDSTMIKMVFESRRNR
jgi:hypothetical protein